MTWFKRGLLILFFLFTGLSCTSVDDTNSTSNINNEVLNFRDKTESYIVYVTVKENNQGCSQDISLFGIHENNRLPKDVVATDDDCYDKHVDSFNGDTIGFSINELHAIVKTEYDKVVPFNQSRW